LTGPDAPRLAPRGATVLLALACAVQAGIVSYHALAAHRLYLTGAFDLGAFDQALWLISRGETPFSTVIGAHILGDHAAYLLYPLALLYVVAPDVRVLLVLQSVVVALGAVPLYLLGRRRRRPWLGLAAGVAFLLHPATLNMALFDFHPGALAGTLLLFALYGLETDRPGLSLAFAALVLAAKESFALTIAGVGLWLAGRGERARGALLFLLSVGTFFLATRLVVPHLSGREASVFLGRYSRYGTDEMDVLKQLVTRPRLVLEGLTGAGNLGYLWRLLSPFMLLPVLGPRYLALAVPPLVLNLLSSFPPQKSLGFHYDSLVVPLLAAACLEGLLLVDRAAGRPARGLALAGLSVCTLLSLATASLRLRDLRGVMAAGVPRAALYDAALSRVPEGVGVSVPLALQPHLAHRVDSFVFPNPFRTRDFLDPEGAGPGRLVDAIVFDTRPPEGAGPPAPDELRTLDELERSGNYRRAYEEDGVIVLSRLARRRS